MIIRNIILDISEFDSINDFVALAALLVLPNNDEFEDALFDDDTLATKFFVIDEFAPNNVFVVFELDIRIIITKHYFKDSNI